MRPRQESESEIVPDAFRPWHQRHSRMLGRGAVLAVVVAFVGCSWFGSSQTSTPDADPEVPKVDGFDPIPEPGPSDWLAVHDESGQTVERWSENHADKRGERVILLQPIGDFDGRAPRPEILAEYVSIYFGVEARSLPPIAIDELPGVDSRERDGGYRQYLSSDFLDALADRKGAETDTLMGITMVDLYPRESWNFVFGQASLQRGVGIMSFNRFDPSHRFSRPAREGETEEQAILRRSLKLLTHELGHTFGIHHCVFYHCVMNGSNNLAESDRSPLSICPVDLEKLELARGFDKRRRYNRLADWYADHALWQMADWARARARAVAAEE